MRYQSLLVFALLPFVQVIFALDTDVSYLVVLSALLLLWQKRNALLYWQLEFVAVSMLFSLVLLFSLPVTKAIGPFILALLYVCYRSYILDSKLIFFAAIVYGSMGILYIVNGQLAYSLQSHLVGNIKWATDAQRAFPVLGTEAGLMAGVFVMLAELSFAIEKVKIVRNILVLTFLLLAFQTKSGSLLVFLLIFIVNRSLSLRQVLWASLALSLLIFVNIDFIAESRVLSFIQNFSESANILFFDTSLAYRVSALMGSIEVMYSNLFYFLGDKNEEMQFIYRNKYYILNPNMDRSFHDVSSLGLLLRTGGIFTLLWLVYFIKLVGISRKTLYLLCTMAFSYSIFFPLSLMIVAQNKLGNVWNNRK